MAKDVYKNGKKQLKKDIENFFTEQRKHALDIFDDTTIQGYGNILLNRAVNLLDTK